MRRAAFLALGAVGLGLASGCGGSGKSSSPPTTSAPRPTASTPKAKPAATPGAAALQAEAATAATGDIPDNQVFLTFKNVPAGYSIKYPEGWAQGGSGPTVTFRDKNNIVRVVVANAAPPTVSSVATRLAALPSARVTGQPAKTTVGGKPAIHAVYETRSAQNAVTGKSVTLGVDRYYLWDGKRVAIVDLGTPVAPVKVDNVDAYRLIVQSFRWR
jgi:hypothetical protein